MGVVSGARFGADSGADSSVYEVTDVGRRSLGQPAVYETYSHLFHHAQQLHLGMPQENCYDTDALLGILVTGRIPLIAIASCNRPQAQPFDCIWQGIPMEVDNSILRLVRRPNESYLASLVVKKSRMIGGKKRGSVVTFRENLEAPQDFYLEVAPIFENASVVHLVIRTSTSNSEALRVATQPWD
ncbi:MAG: hypothetical protein LBJ03_03600 [Holosporales bacterium]|nr:hypothetical protein [Holosporales bacterium]